MEKAQVSMEAIFVVAILLLILLFSMVYIFQKEESSRPLVEENKNFSECHKIASAIATVSRAEAVSVQSFVIENSVKITMNNIVIGNTACNYFGNVEGQETGVELEKGQITVRKDLRGRIFVEQS
jgi:uncharacterized protein (UPF0333 family)